MCCVYLLDSVFITDSSKFVSGILCCLSAMLQLELPHINILTKIDLLEKKDEDDLRELCDPDLKLLETKMEEEAKYTNDKYKLLTSNIAQLLKMYDMVSFLPYSKSDVETVSMVLAHVDHAIQYGEDKEPIEPDKWNKKADDQQDHFYEQQQALFQKQKETQEKMSEYKENDTIDID